MHIRTFHVARLPLSCCEDLCNDRSQAQQQRNEVNDLHDICEIASKGLPSRSVVPLIEDDSQSEIRFFAWHRASPCRKIMSIDMLAENT